MVVTVAMSFNDVASVSSKGNDYRIRFYYMSKDEAINLLKNADLTKKMWSIIIHENLFSNIKDR